MKNNCDVSGDFADCKISSLHICDYRKKPESGIGYCIYRGNFGHCVSLRAIRAAIAEEGKDEQNTSEE